MEIIVNGEARTVADETSTLLDALRGEFGLTSVKDGCSPQGQCGCCTVLVDGQARVSCVTPVRRVRDRQITTVEGLDDETRAAQSKDHEGHVKGLGGKGLAFVKIDIGYLPRNVQIVKGAF